MAMMKAISTQRAGRSPAAPETLTPSSSQKHRPPRIPKENVDPFPESSPFRSPASAAPAGKPFASKNRSPLPPRPPSHGSTPAKKKLNLETLELGATTTSGPQADSGVQVIVRMRPPSNDEEEGDLIVEKISPNAVSLLDHTFTFDSVADTKSTQEDIFRLVGLPLVENCLAGFNSSIFAYGQTGSGKTYTMWGPPSALLEDASSNSEQGLTPRVFQQLFSRIEEEQAKYSDKQLTFQCRCSFLEIYNEQITDLLEPTKRNLQVREDVKTGIYVEYLTEEHVSTMKDVTQLLGKGLANRRIGATSINAESSRSHCVFTCIVESRSKSAEDGLISLRTSRINLVDLAGSERQKQTGAAGERLKEAGNINRSLSQLGNLINILAEVSQFGKQRHIPYRDSRLTFLLQESLGGNAKLAMICAISPSQSCKSETFSTLRFAQRAKAIKNKAVVNETTEDDVNVLREQIRQLKDEILRMKSNESTANKGNYTTLWDARRSLSLLKMSLSRSRVLPDVKDDSDEEMEIDESDVEVPCNQAAMPCSEDERYVDLTKSKEEVKLSACDSAEFLKDMQPDSGSDTCCGDDHVCEADAAALVMAKHDVPFDCISIQSDEKCEAQNTDEEKYVTKDFKMDTESKSLLDTKQIIVAEKCPNHLSSSGASSLSIVPWQSSTALQPPTLSISPVADANILKNSITLSATQEKSDGETSHTLTAAFSRKSQKSLLSTEDLAASLQRGLEIIDKQRHSSVLSRSSFRFSISHTDVKPMLPVKKFDIGVQTDIHNAEPLEDSFAYICHYCKKKATEDKSEDINNHCDMQLVPIDESISTDKLKVQVPKAVEKVLAGSIRREMALEEYCAKQNAEIAQLNRLVQQYKHERECSAIIAQTREDKISRLESLMDGILPTEEFMDEEFKSLANEHKLLKEKYENHPEILRINIELQRIQEELDGYKNFFHMGERDVLMEEIQDLRSQLQYYINSSPKPTYKPHSLLQLTYSSGPTSDPLATMQERTEVNTDDKVDPERCSWTEKESQWISLCEELRIELEASRSCAEKLKLEVDSEKKCAEELKEALQTAMQGHVRILEQYTDLQEKHIELHSRNRKISEGIEDVKKAAARAGVKGAESKFINSLAAQISVLRMEREKERRYWRDENKGLQAQLRDTAEAVQAAGELLLRLKEAEEAAATAEKKALLAEQETEKAYQEIDKLKKAYNQQILLLNQFLAESRLPKEAIRHPEYDATDVAKYDGGSYGDQRWREEFEPFCNRGDTESSKDIDPTSWFSGYDRCNI